MKTRNTQYYRHGDLETSRGNPKIGRDSLIFNLCPASLDCPGERHGLCACASICYAKKSELLYNSVLTYRLRQKAYWESNDYRKIANDFSDLLANKRTKNPATGKLEALYKSIKYLRINEAGEFDTQADINKLDAVAIILKKRFGLKTYTYTTRSDLEFRHTHFAVKGSGHSRGNSGRCDVRSPEQVEQGRVGNKYHEDGKTWTICPGDCSKCKLCKEFNNIDVVFVAH